MPAYPSATTGVVPTATPIPNSNSAIVYFPSDAWNKSKISPNCSQSQSVYVTQTVNATVSFNYTGPSIVVNTISSHNGGLFSVLVDGFNTTSAIDTNTAIGGNVSLPTCYPIQFPPFVITPPNYQSRTNHTIELVFIGSAPTPAQGTTASVGQFDSFAIPDLESAFGVATSRNRRSASFDLGLATACIVVALFHSLAF
ncbi:hypothetical protein CVT26_013520 [Gymnopilus dilepis]|uniref:Uncharacterized protein n=1 Tax=Gymnopilus dilepis TaxID=231916 RepID=A0A409Y5H1_9AGAR|nr:hypothetical protein CVT26_013520 [Gymnopilus dilepis]